jgi:hypothetical protein
MAVAANASNAKPLAIPADIAKYTTHMPSILEMKAAKDNFKFDDGNAEHNFFILLSSPPKFGKTHFACTVSSLMPTYLLDTEFKGGTVAKKFTGKGDLKYKIIRNFVEMAAAVRYITTTQPRGCIILDSGSDLQTFAEELYLTEMGKDSVGLPRNWADVFSKCNAIIKEVKAAGFDLILTTRVKEQWKNNAATGKVVPRIWDNASYLADIAVEWDEDKKPWVKLNALRKQMEPVAMTATSVGELLSQLKEQTKDVVKAA